jgi:hypothetical protein
LIPNAGSSEAVIEKVRETGFVRDVALGLLDKAAREIPVSLNASSFRDARWTGRRRPARFANTRINPAREEL